MPWALLILGMAAAYVAAGQLQDTGLLSITPPPSEFHPVNQPDAIGREFWLHLSAYTAWVTTLLIIPAFLFVWFEDRAPDWKAFWAAGWIAYLIHLGVAMFGFFESDYEWMTTSSRVSAFWPGMLLAVWWGLDLALANKTHPWVTIQRFGVHLMAFVLFFGGSAIKGELLTIQIIGYALLAVTLIAAIRWLAQRRAAS